jgi:hypothetical protein
LTRRRRQAAVPIPPQIPSLLSSPAGYFLWKAISSKITQESSGVGVKGDHTWKRLIFRSFPEATFTSLFPLSIILEKEGKKVVELRNQDVASFFDGCTRKFRDGGSGKIIPPFHASFSPSSHFLSILFRYVAMTPDGKEELWVAPNMATYLQNNQ